LQSPDRQTLLLDLNGADVDLLAFDAAIKRNKLSDLKQAVALYRGPLLEGCPEEWVFQERAAREQDCLQALQTLADAALNAGDFAAASRYYQRAVLIDPFSDTARRGWMEALARSGDRNVALQVYREYVELLRSDPTATPDEQTTALYTRLRAEARNPARAQETAATPTTPFPTVSGYLPHPLTDLVGREDERLEVKLSAALSTGDSHRTGRHRQNAVGPPGRRGERAGVSGWRLAGGVGGAFGGKAGRLADRLGMGVARGIRQERAGESDRASAHKTRVADTRQLRAPPGGKRSGLRPPAAITAT
jgi:tetratricopeptide (TPR) repeat protein